MKEVCYITNGNLTKLQNHKNWQKIERIIF